MPSWRVTADMDTGSVLDLARQATQIGLLVMLPILAVALFVGVLVSVFQAVTQVQEMTLTFAPKVLGIAVVVSLMGGWMLDTLVKLFHMCLDHIARVGQ